jgi:hypothetical protein
LDLRLGRTLAQVRHRQLRTAIQGEILASAHYAKLAQRLWRLEGQPRV